MCTRVVAGKATRGLGDRVYVGKEGGWLEGKVEVRPRVGLGGRQERTRGKERKIDLPRALVSPIRVLFVLLPTTLHDIHPSFNGRLTIALRRGAPKRDVDNRVNRRTCGVEARVNIFVTSPASRAVRGSDNSAP